MEISIFIQFLFWMLQILLWTIHNARFISQSLNQNVKTWSSSEETDFSLLQSTISPLQSSVSSHSKLPPSIRNQWIEQVPSYIFFFDNPFHSDVRHNTACLSTSWSQNIFGTVLPKSGTYVKNVCQLTVNF